jgi:protein-glutamine gamma-glutamyltransferase
VDTSTVDKAKTEDFRERVTSSRAVERYFQLSLVLTLVTAFFTLASTGRIDAPTVALVSLALIIRLIALVLGRDFRLSPRAVTLFSVFYLFFYTADILLLTSGPTLLDRVLAATVHLVLFAAVIKVYSAATRRDSAYLAILSFLMMLVAAILTVSAGFLAGFCLYVLFAISTLMSYQVIGPASAIARGPRQGFPAGTGSSRLEPVEGALGKTAIGVALGLIPLAAGLFFLIPRYRSGYLSAVSLEGQKITGFSESVDLGDIGRIMRSSQVLMRVTVEGDRRRFEGVKWRGVALSDFDGRRWSNADPRGRLLTPVAPGAFRLPPWEGPRTWPQSLLRYRVQLAPISTDVLFAAGRTREISAPVRFLVVDEAASIHNPQHAGVPFGYGAVSEAVTPTPSELRQASGDYPPEIKESYLGLPALDPRIAALARETAAGADNNYDRIVALQDYLRTRFYYTLELPPVQPADPIASFLFDTRRGNCEYFAASLAVMLRTLGVPSRLVNGFETGSYNPVGKDFVVRGYDAHSWVEAYFPTYGWISFDPTPAGAESIASGFVSDYLDAAALFWNEWVINYDFGHQVQLAGAVESGSRSADRQFRTLRWRFEHLGLGAMDRGKTWLQDHRVAALGTLLVLLALAALASNPVWIERLATALRWKLEVWRNRPSQHTATAAYHRFLEIVGRQGFQKAPAETALEFAAKLGSAKAEGASLRRSAMAFTELYQALRFGHRSVSAADLEASLQALPGPKPSAQYPQSD